MVTGDPPGSEVKGDSPGSEVTGDSLVGGGQIKSAKLMLANANVNIDQILRTFDMLVFYLAEK